MMVCLKWAGWSDRIKKQQTFIGFVVPSTLSLVPQDLKDDVERLVNKVGELYFIRYVDSHTPSWIFVVTWIAGGCHRDRVLNLGLAPLEGRRFFGFSRFEALIGDRGEVPTEFLLDRWPWKTTPLGSTLDFFLCFFPLWNFPSEMENFG